MNSRPETKTGNWELITKNSSHNQPFESCDLPYLLQKADIVSLHARHSNQKNKALLGEKELQLMKKGAFLIWRISNTFMIENFLKKYRGHDMPEIRCLSSSS